MGGKYMKEKVLVATLLAIALLLTLCGCGKESRSIGIIGGADGPTAIFVGTPNKE
jgi:Na+-transporting methylmalonyl-CoA/oxaloacetate decarboxylase beta subunit